MQSTTKSTTKQTTPQTTSRREGPTVPTGKIKWYDTEKGFGFITRDDGPDVFVHSTALPTGVAELKSGQRVEFGVAAGKRGETAIGVHLLETRPSVEAAGAARDRKPAEGMGAIV